VEKKGAVGATKRIKPQEVETLKLRMEWKLMARSL
jgi:hypothetical protein